MLCVDTEGTIKSTLTSFTSSIAGMLYICIIISYDLCTEDTTLTSGMSTSATKTTGDH